MRQIKFIIFLHTAFQPILRCAAVRVLSGGGGQRARARGKVADAAAVAVANALDPQGVCNCADMLSGR